MEVYTFALIQNTKPTFKTQTCVMYIQKIQLVYTMTSDYLINSDNK